MGGEKQLGIQGLGEKSVISLTEWQNTEGDSATDGGIRNQRQGCRWIPTRSVFDTVPHSVSEIRLGDEL